MFNFEISATDEFGIVFKESFESLSEAQKRFSEWFSWSESGETPLNDLKLEVIF
jgi:hypothetical protein